MKKLVVLMSMLVMFTMVGFVGQAMALIPTIDGVAGAGEWVLADMHTFATDVDEVGIPSQYDIHHLWAQQVDLGGATDGLYFRVDLFGDPTTTGGIGSLGAEAFVQIRIDFDGNGTLDMILDFNDGVSGGAGLAAVYSGYPTGAGTLLGSASGAVVEGPGGIYEFYLPESFFDVFFDITAETGFNVLLDNRGEEPDDTLPNSGFTTGIPEPASIILIGTGMLGLMGFRRKIAA